MASGQLISEVVSSVPAAEKWSKKRGGDMDTQRLKAYSKAYLALVEQDSLAIPSTPPIIPSAPPPPGTPGRPLPMPGTPARPMPGTPAGRAISSQLHGRPTFYIPVVEAARGIAAWSVVQYALRILNICRALGGYLPNLADKFLLVLLGLVALTVVLNPGIMISVAVWLAKAGPRYIGYAYSSWKDELYNELLQVTPIPATAWSSIQTAANTTNYYCAADAASWYSAIVSGTISGVISATLVVFFSRR